jgi:hypothetical protein
LLTEIQILQVLFGCKPSIVSFVSTSKFETFANFEKLILIRKFGSTTSKKVDLGWPHIPYIDTILILLVSELCPPIKNMILVASV